MAWLKQYYEEEVMPKLMEKFGYKNRLEVPRLEKIVLNMGLGEAVQNPKIIDQAVEELAMIAGQRPSVRRARKSIAAFKLREGMPIGVMATLRKQRMYDFFTRLVNVALPRVRDFRGVPRKGFDGRGNYTMGISDHTIFPEVDPNKVDKIKGMNITFVTSAKTDEEAYELLKLLGMPFKRR
ncbi:MAG: 50S ribosomal protein L5 [Thermodesulfobacteria bacterium]|nr:50S ribosomal protein L5 [Thermodesulfobacteriota bacterium]